ncbi:AAA family ATPase [Spirulina subsalsa]|uniref:AAA family ATPase n=1 Tax=Spirulina subsalsa TaxID=54311 RepID=UPI00030C9A5B|nr:ATP-binding protein [Spirulina subsalsa]
MDTEKLVSLADHLVFTQTGKHLTTLQKTILRETFGNQPYSRIARECKFTEGHIRDVASDLWKILSDGFGEKINKSNVSSILERAVFAFNSPTFGDNTQIQEFNFCPGTHSTVPDSTQTPEPTTFPCKTYLISTPEVPQFFGRTSELDTLKQYILNQHCRLITIQGLTGIGKTALTLKLLEEIQSHFHTIYYSSLRFSPPLTDTLTSLLKFLTETETTPQNPELQLHQLLEYLKQYPTLIIWDDVQHLLSAEPGGQWKSERENYEFLCKVLGEVAHCSCVLLLSWEQPLTVTQLQSCSPRVKSLSLGGLGKEAEELLQAMGLREEDWQGLIEKSQGNPLWLKLMVDRIEKRFEGRVQEFLSHRSLQLDKC